MGSSALTGASSYGNKTSAFQSHQAFGATRRLVVISSSHQAVNCLRAAPIPLSDVLSAQRFAVKEH